MLGKWQCCEEKQEILSGWDVSLQRGWCARSWAEPGEVALPAQERAWLRDPAALAGSCWDRDFPAPGREQHCCCSTGIRGVLLSQHKLPELLLHQLKAGPRPCLLLHKGRHFWCILMASEVTEFPLMSCLPVEGCLATLNHLFFHSSNEFCFPCEQTPHISSVHRVGQSFRKVSNWPHQQLQVFLYQMGSAWLEIHYQGCFQGKKHLWDWNSHQCCLPVEGQAACCRPLG